MKLLTFLGTGNYRETTYFWNEQEHTSKYAPSASCRFLKPNHLVVFCTEEAHEQVFPDFSNTLPPELTVETQPIPLGKNEQELWQLFSRVMSVVQPEETVAFDITHGLRSFPYTSLLVAAYLRAAFRVEIAAVLYGAWEVGDKNVTPNRAPMFDLSPMLSLLEWGAAADRFNRTGDARYLASLLEKQKDILAKAAQGNHDVLTNLSSLNNLAGNLKEISQSLRLIRPHQAMQAVDRLPKYVERARPLLEELLDAQPFHALLNNVTETYKPLACANPRQTDNRRLTLEKEREMLHWYLEREQWVQAVSLAREWLVSFIMLHLGITELTVHTERLRVEGFINSEAEAFLQAKLEQRQFVPLFLRAVPETETVLTLWKALTDTRNDIDHAGMRENPEDPGNLVKNIEKYIKQLDELPLPELEPGKEIQ